MSSPPEKPSTREKNSLGDLPKLSGDDSVSRDRFLSISRNYLSVLKTSLLEFRTKGTQGRVFVRSYSRIVDAIVSVLFQRAVQEHGASPDDAGIAIIGAGGYGRSELAPYSDVDILILCRRKTPQVKQIVSSFIQLMWDVGFELGHSVQSLVESESSLMRHMDTRTALFESRWVCGSKKVAREVDQLIKRLKRKDRESFLKRKIRDAVARYKKHGESYQLIEPNVKLSPGGLRDFQTLVWLGMVVRSGSGLSALRKKGLLLPGEVTALEEAYDFLLRVRVELHVATESKQDQLTVQMQKAITERLGYGGRGGHLGVELFMKDYYDYTRTIHRITEDILEELQYGKNLGVLLGKKRSVSDGAKLSVRVNTKKIKQEPLYVFERQKNAGLKLNRGLKRRLSTILHNELSGRLARSKMQRAFPGLLQDGRNLSLVLRSMHETGFLGHIIPEYNFLTSLKRYDLYHHYTVDEHSFQVVRNIELLGTTRAKSLIPFARIYSEVADKQVLFLAALLHDIGKIEGRGHAKKGAALSRKILKRMAVTPDRIETISFLIEIHLLMSHVSQRRDPSDIGTLQTFVSSVKNRSNLKRLCLLTFADLKATSPLVWTEWKRTLLWDLYLKAYQFMAQKEKKPEAFYKARKQTILRSFTRGKERTLALRHLDLLPGRYLLTMRAAQVRMHMDMIDQLGVHGAVARKRKRKLTTEITFCTFDKPYRLSQICGVLTLNDCNILYANAFTRTDGKVIDVFHVEDISGTDPIDDSRVDIIQQDLDRVLQGALDITSVLKTHVLKWKRTNDSPIPVPVKIKFENDESGDVTIVDLFCSDHPGLLFKLTRALSEEGLIIHRARISTEANRAIDSFDVQDKNGKKISDINKLKRIRQRLEAVFS